jgi:hypothetical protein
MGMKRLTAYALIGLAMADHGGAGPGWAARLHGAAGQALADLGAVEPLEGRLADLDRQRLRAAMGAEAFEAAYAAGRTLDLARAAHEALQGMQAERKAERAAALVSEPDAAGSGEAVMVLTPREREVGAEARRAGTEQLRHRPAAGIERAAARSVVNVPELLSPTYRNRVRKLSPRNRNSGVKDLPGSHTVQRAISEQSQPENGFHEAGSAG